MKTIIIGGSLYREYDCYFSSRVKHPNYFNDGTMDKSFRLVRI